jgi:diaminohydroxyphosphoribosylaminopyrimidine deaminase/5-amino-6-(5-phosphoribosylamino)uracil reductase
MVGCVVVSKDGHVVGEGFHARAGESHAEVLALDQAGAHALGGTLYCSLEPCCHFGRTPPCSDRVIKSGVARVVVGIEDPNPKVEGGGIRALKEAGIEVVVGILKEDCRYQNRGFLKAIQQGVPWLALKMAVTLDGKIADRDGGSQWITGVEARKFVMLLRSKFDAVMVGAGTARADDPSLTVRIDEDSPSGANPIRVVVDPTLSLSPMAKLFAPAGAQVRTIVFCSQDESMLRQSPSVFPGHVEVIAVGCNEDIDWKSGSVRLDLRACLAELKERGVRKALCEGGAQLAGSLFDDNLVDEAYWFVAPKILADEQSLPAVISYRPRLIGDVINLRVKDHKVLGDDMLIHALLHQA